MFGRHEEIAATTGEPSTSPAKRAPGKTPSNNSSRTGAREPKA